eukprot:3647422-Amphidinium_carterae.1
MFRRVNQLSSCATSPTADVAFRKSQSLTQTPAKGCGVAPAPCSLAVCFSCRGLNKVTVKVVSDCKGVILALRAMIQCHPATPQPVCDRHPKGRHQELEERARVAMQQPWCRTGSQLCWTKAHQTQQAVIHHFWIFVALKLRVHPEAWAGVRLPARAHS